MPKRTVFIYKERRFNRLEEEELITLYTGLVEHGGDAADEALMEEIGEELSRRGVSIEPPEGVHHVA